MAGWSETSGAARGAAAGAVVCVVAVVGWWFATDRAGGPKGDAPTETVASTAAPAAAPATAPAADTAPAATEAGRDTGQTSTADAAPADGAAKAPEAGSAQTETAAADPAPTVASTDAASGQTAGADMAGAAGPALPGFDVVRVETDGSTTVAGQAPAGSAVSLRLDGVEFQQATADASGQFASLFTLPPSDAPRLLTVTAKLADGTEVAGKDSVALAAIAAPAEGASATAAQPAQDGSAIGVMVVDGVVKALVPQNAPQPAADTAMVALDTIAYGPDGSVQLGGHGAPEAAVRIYLDGAQRAEAKVGADAGWSVSMMDIQPGLYTLRLDQLDAAGKVTARFETPFKRETLEALALATAATAGANAQPAAAELAPAADGAATAGAAPAAAQGGTEAGAASPEPAAPQVTGEQTAAAAPEAQADQSAPAGTDGTQASPLVSGGDGTAQTAAVEPTSTVTPAPKPATAVTVTVQPGFTLWGIAQSQLGEGVMYVQVYKANKDKIRNPDLIYPGQVFTIPGSN